MRSLVGEVFAVTVTLVTLGACGGAASAVTPVSASAKCLDQRPAVASRWGTVNAVAGAFVVPAADVAAWQETRDASRGIRPVSELRGRGAEQMLVCFFDGDFDSFPGRGNRPAYDRIVVIFDPGGRPTLDSAGPHDHLKVERPGPRP